MPVSLPAFGPPCRSQSTFSRSRAADVERSFASKRSRGGPQAWTAPECSIRISHSRMRMVLMTRGRRAGRVYSRACSVAQEGEAWGCRAISELLFASGSACQSLCVLAGAFVRASLPLVFSTSSASGVPVALAALVALVPRGQDFGGLLRPSGAEEALMPERRRRCPPSESMRIRGGVSFEAKRPRFRGPPASKRSRGSPQPRKAPGRLHRNP